MIDSFTFSATSSIPPRHGPVCYRPLSLKLFQVMEDIDATTENKQNSIEASTYSDVLGTIAHQPTFTWNTFGSAYEGSTTYDMGSDVDSVLVYQDFKVLQDCATALPGKSLLLIQDEVTPAGYAKLQLIYDGVPLFSRDNHRVILADNVFKKSIDRSNRIILSYNIPHVSKSIVSRNERHGPAMSIDPNRAQLAKDIVLALGCDSWPACASEWLTRQRLFDWPPSDVLETCKVLGCLFVSIGHQLSEEEHMQWRISLSYQERLLISLFNSVQLKVFILLKMIRKELIDKSVTKESLSSYHIKTCMLYMIENTPSDFWKPENMLICLIRCLEMIQVWVQNGVCPNYFIPGENMFERRVHGEVRENLQLVLQQLLAADCKFLLSIQTSDVGERLRVACSPSPNEVFPPFDDEFGRNIPRIGKLGQLCIISLYIVHCRNAILKMGVSSKESIIVALFDNVKQLKNTDKISVYTQEETKRVVSHVLPYIELSLMSNIVEKAVEEKKDDDTIWRLLTSHSWNKMGSVSDAFTAKLKQATLMYTYGYYQSSVYVLRHLESQVGFSVCDCNEEEKKTPYLQTLLHAAKEMPNISVEDFVKNFMRPCIVFLPSERDVVPLPLQYEMRRSEGSPEGSRHEPFHFWYDWAVVDPKMLLYLLLYLNNKQLNRMTDAAACLKTIEATRGFEMSHPETNLNIIGWMYKDSGDLRSARNMFGISLRIKPYHNAALLHLDDLNTTIMSNMSFQTWN